MLCDGLLVSETCAEPRMRLKLADVLHSTATPPKKRKAEKKEKKKKKRSGLTDRLFLRLLLGAKDFGAFTVVHGRAAPGLNLPLAERRG